MSQSFAIQLAFGLALILGLLQICAGPAAFADDLRADDRAQIHSVKDPLATNAGELSLAALKSMSLEELGAIQVETVVGASKHEQKTTEAPSDVSIVTQDDIKKYGHRTLADILNSVRGFYVTYDRG